MKEPQVTRKLAAILFADVVGFSRLMGADEAGTLATLKAHRNVTDPFIYNHGGRIVKTMGDGLLVEFPSVVAAVEAAVEVQRTMAERNASLPDDRRMLYRIGVHLGDVIVEDDDLYGDGVNITARIEAAAEPGGISVSGAVRDSIHKKLDLTLLDLGPQNFKNIAEPVAVWRVDMGEQRSRALADAAEKGERERSAVAVLPFDNISDDPGQEYFADGIAEDIITALSQISGFKVIARNSTFVFKGQATDVKLIAKEVDARYVLEGSVRKAGERVRISAQLIDGTTGQHIWAERYDRELTDIFAVQDEITQSIVARAAPEIVQTETKRVLQKSTADLDAWDTYLRARPHYYEGTKTGHEEARRLCQESIALDPDFAAPYQLLSEINYLSIMVGWLKSTREEWTNLVRLAETAVKLAENDAQAVAGLASVYAWTGRHDDAVAQAERALAINPSHPMVAGTLGGVYFMCGRHEEAIKYCLEEIQLNPRNPALFHMATSMGFAHYALGQYESALSWADRGLILMPEHIQCDTVRAVALAQLGRVGEAKEPVERFLARFPDATCSSYFRSFRWRNPEDIEHFKEGLRKAGLPEK